MNNFVIGLKRFATNKNVVTIVLVLVALGLLFWGYTSTLKKQTNPVNLPVAATTISARTKLTNENIKYVKVASSMISSNVIRTSKDLIDKYVNINVTVPEGSPFYEEWVVEEKDVPGNWVEQLDRKKGELGYYMSVDMNSTLGNSVLPNSYIDIYMKATDENGVIMFGKLMENIKVLVVHDNSGKNVFDNVNSIGTASKIGFAVSQDLYILLKKANYLGIDLQLVPRGSTVPDNDYIIVKSSTLRDYIDAQTITVEEDLTADDMKNNTDNTENNTNNNTDNNTNTNNEANNQ